MSSSVGYTGGAGGAPPPTYESVCGRNNTYTEAVRLVFDPAELSFDELMRRVAAMPRVQRASASTRRQTRVAVWAQDAAQAASATAILSRAGKPELPVLPPSAWHEAEEHHQNFLAEEKDFPDWSDGSELGGPGTAWGL